jgi:hypothetical protein
MPDFLTLTDWDILISMPLYAGIDIFEAKKGIKEINELV